MSPCTLRGPVWCGARAWWRRSAEHACPRPIAAPRTRSPRTTPGTRTSSATWAKSSAATRASSTSSASAAGWRPACASTPSAWTRPTRPPTRPCRASRAPRPPRQPAAQTWVRALCHPPSPPPRNALAPSQACPVLRTLTHACQRWAIGAWALPQTARTAARARAAAARRRTTTARRRRAPSAAAGASGGAPATRAAWTLRPR